MWQVVCNIFLCGVGGCRAFGRHSSAVARQKVKHTKEGCKVMKRIVALGVGLLLALWAADAQLLKFGARVGLNTGVYDFEDVHFADGVMHSPLVGLRWARIALNSKIYSGEVFCNTVALAAVVYLLAHINSTPCTK